MRVRFDRDPTYQVHCVLIHVITLQKAGTHVDVARDWPVAACQMTVAGIRSDRTSFLIKTKRKYPDM